VAVRCRIDLGLRGCVEKGKKNFLRGRGVRYRTIAEHFHCSGSGKVKNRLLDS